MTISLTSRTGTFAASCLMRFIINHCHHNSTYWMSWSSGASLLLSILVLFRVRSFSTVTVGESQFSAG
jgi:hypothetical protein